MRKNHRFHRKCLQQLNLRTTPVHLKERRDERPPEDQTGGLPDSGATHAEVETDYWRVTTSSDYKLKAPLTFCLEAQETKDPPSF